MGFFLACVFIKCLNCTFAPSLLSGCDPPNPPSSVFSRLLSAESIFVPLPRGDGMKVIGKKEEKAHTSIEMEKKPPNSLSMPGGAIWPRPEASSTTAPLIIGSLPIIRAHLLHTKSPPPSLPSFLPSAALRCFNRARINRGSCPACQIWTPSLYSVSESESRHALIHWRAGGR